MDVHAPHEPIHSWKDFLLHLFTITIGLLIAVGIEGCVELHHEHKLVKEARATLREEIEHNSKSLADDLKNLADEKAEIGKDIDYLTKIQEHPKDTNQHGSMGANFSNISLDDTAWRTAQSTGALSYMPYAEAQKYADLYESQSSFLAAQDKILDDEAKFIGLIAKIGLGDRQLTSDQAGLFAEDLGTWSAHLTYLDLMAKLASQSDKAFLEGKEGPKSMHEDESLGGDKPKSTRHSGSRSGKAPEKSR